MRFKNKTANAESPYAKMIRNRDIRNVVAMLLSQIGVQGLCSTLITTYVSYFYTNFMLVSITLVSTMMAIGTIIDGVSDFAMGFVVERVETKHGHIKHWFLWSAIPVAVCTALMFWCDPNWSATVKMVYFFIVYNLFTLAITTVRLPGYSAMSLCFTNNKARESAGLAIGLGGQVGNTITSMMIAPVIALLGGGLAAYRTSATVFAGIGGLFILVSFFFITEVRGSEAGRRNAAMYDETIEVDDKMPLMKEKKEKLTFKQLLFELSLLFRNQYWVLTVIGGIFNGMALGFILGSVVYFCNDVLQNPMAMMGVFGVMSISMMIGLLICAPLLVFMDAKWINIIGSLIGGIGLVIACIGVFVFDNLWLLYAGIAVRQFGSGMFAGTDTDLNARLIDFGEWKFGVRQDGLSFSGRSVISKLTASLATAIMGWLLAAAGYKGALEVQPDSAINMIKWIFLFLPMIFQFITAFMYCFYGITNKRLGEIQADLKERHNAHQ